MGQARGHWNIKLIFGFLYRDEEIFDKAASAVIRRFGPFDYRSGIMAFNKTRYYEKEFGPELKRRFVSSRKLTCAGDIHRIKLFTNKLEKRFMVSGKRLVNIDPGYVTLGKLVLLTTKDQSHRIYLKKGIYAESTLKYQGSSYVPWPTTYPDYSSEEYISVFNRIREIYSRQVRNARRNP